MPYPTGYTVPKFIKFDGKQGNAREQVVRFIETLGVHGSDHSLRLREFSKLTPATPFSLVYGFEAALPVELAVPSARMAMSAHLVPDSRKNDIEAAEERRDWASRAMEKYHQSVARAYNQSVQHTRSSINGTWYGRQWTQSCGGNQFPSSHQDGKAPTKLLRQPAAGTTS
ncbi:hypothetical protein CsSME_00015093 [Camellia sinensis var. sinensis]